MARWQRWNVSVLREIRQRLGWTPEEFALRLRIWQIIDWLNTDVFPGAGIVALRTYLDQDTLEGVSPDQLPGVESYLEAVLKQHSRVKRGGAVAGATIRRWENGEFIPGIAQLHVLCDALDMHASAFFEPQHPGRPASDATKNRQLAQTLAPLAAKMRANFRPQPKRGRGRPRKVIDISAAKPRPKA